MLKLLNIKIPKDKELVFYLNQENENFANEFIKKNKLQGRYLIGVHPGCNRANEHRRWPKENFAILIDNLTKENKIIFLFAGPDEIKETEWIYKNIKETEKVFLINETNLKNVSALIKKCKMFICTDSGLGHISTALKIPTLAIFGPAQYSRTKPYGEYGGYISLNLSCSPCLKYPFFSTSSRINCINDFRCLKNIKPREVLNKLNNLN
jgi:heptosyltransferase-2